MTTMDTPVVSVCVCTFRRPALLARLLAALAKQVGAPRFEVIVVDNDDQRSAGPVLAAAASESRLSLRLGAETRQNIALARNATVRLARGAWIAFVDDDEEPVPSWLADLHRIAIARDADAVAGPVVPRLPREAPAWLVRSGLYDRPRHATGATVPSGELRTGNLLIRRETLLHGAAPDGPFDPAFGLSGGSDSKLLRSLADAGALFLWCDEAEVFETIPRGRTRLRYLVENAFGAGHIYARQRVAALGLRAAPALAIRGAGAVAVGSAMALGALPLGRHRAAPWARLAVIGMGKLLGLAGGRFERYAHQ